jgi:superfamily II DNA or RNA helicase
LGQKEGITLEQLVNSHWLQVGSKKSIEEGGVGKSYRGLYKAIIKDNRFQTNGRPDFSKFLVFVGLQEVVNISFKEIVSNWKTKEDVISWSKEEGIAIEQLGNSGWLLVGSKKSIEEGGVGKSYTGLYNAIKKDNRFQTDGKPDFSKFLVFVGLQEEVRVNIDFKEIVSNWKTKEDVINWAKKGGITLEQLGNSRWLYEGSKKSIEEGGVGKSYTRLYKAIKNDKRFKSDGNSDFSKFQEFIGLIRHDYQEVLGRWETREDAINWAKEDGITPEQLGNSQWLMSGSIKSIEEGGAGKSYRRLYYAIKKDKRFQANGKPDFSKFREFIGFKRDCYKEIVGSWEIREDAINWAKEEGITPEQLGNSQWLCKESKKSIEEGGVAKSYYGLYNAVVERFGKFPDFKKWLLESEEIPQIELIKQLFSSPEGVALRNLAERLGETALAEYLVVAHQDKFQNFDRALIENLRKYLGEIESGTKAGETKDLPEGIFIIDKLSHLKQVVFNNYRDSYQPLFSEGLDKVVEALEKVKQSVKSIEEQKFIDSVIDYFFLVGELRHPKRLKYSLNRDTQFPAAHQKMAMYEIENERAILLADEMGGGKTGSAIGSFELLRDKGLAKKVLIICPSKVMPVWKKALSNGEVGYFKEGLEPKVAYIEKENKDWQSAESAEYVVISLEMTRSKTDKISHIKRLKQLGFDMLIFDEAHNAKSISGTDTERVYSISQSDTIRKGYVMLLSGTPVPNTVVDLAAQIRLLYSGREEIAGVSLEDISAVSNHILKSHPLLVRNLLVRKMMRRKTKDCLPVGCDYERQVVPVTFNPVQLANYTSIVENPFFSATEKIGELRRVCMEAKFDHIKKSIDLVLQDEKYAKAVRPPKMVIAESSYAKGFTRDINDNRPNEALDRETYVASKLINQFGDRLMVFILDGKNSKDRASILEDFEKCDMPAVLLTLTSVSGEGLNITCAADGILVSPTYTVASEEQFSRRMFRSGQKLPVRLQVLAYLNSIEEGIIGYSERKQKIVSGLIDGRPLSNEEKHFLKGDHSKAKQSEPIAYEAKSPRQQALYILSKLKGKGKDEIREFLYADDGKYAKDFARGYVADEETSYSGNTARLLTAIINSLPQANKKKQVADIACACRTLERMYEGARHVSVSSVDINEVALIVGGELLKDPKETLPREVRTMDDLPFENSSMDTAVISLALDMTKHSKKRGESGKERINAFQELNRVLKVGGYAVITLQLSLFNSQNEFNLFVNTIRDNFGFELEESMTGLASAYNKEQNEKYESWVIVLKKTNEIVNLNLEHDTLWRGLRFPRVALKTPEYRGKHKSIAEEKSGAFQDSFSIGSGLTVTFQPTTLNQIEKEVSRKKNEAEVKRLSDKVNQLLTEYGSIQAIPSELLLSITPEEVDISTQQERDAYHRLLLEKYGSLENIPVEQITSKNSHILIRRTSKKKGDYLVLAKLIPERNKFEPFRTRYFYED